MTVMALSQALGRKMFWKKVILKRARQAQRVTSEENRPKFLEADITYCPSVPYMALTGLTKKNGIDWKKIELFELLLWKTTCRNLKSCLLDFFLYGKTGGSP
jgi:hypothetical protein